jgi:4-carboxymuconolactone decarboxylase
MRDREVQRMSKLPERFVSFLKDFPDVGAAYQTLGKAVADAGPLDSKTRELIKLGVAIAAGQEGGTHSHARKAVAAGATADEIRHAVLQTLTTIGFPNMMRGMSWVDDVIESPESSQ